MSIKEITVRLASLNDANAIRDIYRAAISESASQDQGLPAISRQGGLFIAELGETAIGFGGIDFDAREQIRYVYVIPEYQRSGLRVGLKILETMEAAARQRGIRLVRLHAAPDAVRFYEKAGYSAVEPKDLIGHDHEGVEMVKDLASSTVVK